MHENPQKNSKQNVRQLHLATLWKELPGSRTLSPGVFKLEASLVEAQSLLDKGDKRRKGNGETENFKGTQKPTDVGHFLVQ